MPAFRPAGHIRSRERGNKLEINIRPQQIFAHSKGGLIIEVGVISSEYGTYRPHAARGYVKLQSKQTYGTLTTEIHRSTR